MNAQQELARSWLVKAQRDLASARQLSAAPEPYLDVAIYHCQQAAEKAVKGFLVSCDQPFEETHDLEVLVTMACQYAPGFSAWLDAAALLSPYVSEFRYPGELLEPPPDEFGQALEVASGFYAFVLSVLPSEVRP